MIQKYKRVIDASTGKYVWEKRIVGAAIDSDIIVTNPKIVQTPSTLNSVLGAFKSNIDELYGNVKWLALHGGGGIGGNGGNGGGTVTTAPTIKIYGLYKGNSKADLIKVGALKAPSDSYTVIIQLNNAALGTTYNVSAEFNGRTTRFILNKQNSSYSLTLDGLLALTASKNLNVSATASDFETIEPVSIQFIYESLNIDMQMYYGGMWQEYSRTLDYSSVMDGFKVRLRFRSTSNGTVTYSYTSDLKISSTETLNVENETINVKQGLAATVDIDLSQYINSSNFRYSKLYSFKISGNIGDVDAEVSYNFIIITGDELTVSPSTDNWVDFTGDYSTSYFEKGNDFNLGLTIISDRDEVINDIYMVGKMYYATINEETGEEEWTAIDYDSTGTILPDDTGDNYFPIEGYDPAKKKDWLISKAVNTQLQKWLDANNSKAHITGINSLGFSYTIPLAYSYLTSDMFNIERDNVKYAHIKYELYVANIDAADGDKIMIPIENGQITPTYIFKTEVQVASNYIPNYVNGVEFGAGEVDTIYSSNTTLRFNLDTINQRKYNPESINAMVTPTYSITTNGTALPMYLNNTTGVQTGFVNNTNTNNYNALRLSGKSYAYIKKEDITSKFLSKTYPWGMLNKGFTIEICFKSDAHVNPNGTIFSFGQFNKDGELTAGINIDLEEATFIIGATTSTGMDVKTIKTNLIQNDLYQLDFVYKPVTDSDGTSGIIKIYKNGTVCGLTDIELSKLGASSNALNVTFGDLSTDVTFGCKANGTNNTDVNFYGTRFYREALSDQEITKNWLISYACLNRIGNNADGQIDWENKVTPLLKNNYYDSDWHCSLWDYTAMDKDQNHTPKQQSGENLLNAFGDNGWKTDSNNKGYRALPVVVFRLGDNGINKEPSKFYDSYNAIDAARNNSLIKSDDPGDLNQCYRGSFIYYPTNRATAITSEARGVEVVWYMQGTSTQSYYSKNIEMRFFPSDNKRVSGDIANNNNGMPLFTPDASLYLPENEWTLKADLVDSAHANNAACGRFINSSGFMPLNPAQQNIENPYQSKVKQTLEGFPCIVFIDWGTHGDDKQYHGTQFLGIYSFNLGRASYFNLGFKVLDKYELTEDKNPNIDTLSDADYDNPDTFNSIETCEKENLASFVSRYIMEDPAVNPNVYSFEGDDNTPAEVVGFGQPDETSIERLWSLKYTTNPDETVNSPGYQRLKYIAAGLSLINSDNYNYWGESNVPEYYYMLNSGEDKPGPAKVYRSASNFNKYILYNDVYKVNGKELTTNGNKDPNTGADLFTYTINGTEYTDLILDYLRWYEGVNLNANAQDLTSGKKAVYSNDGTLRSATSDLPQLLLTDYRIRNNIGFYIGDDADHGVENYGPTMNELSTMWIHYPSFARYYIIALVFGMVDSLGKNLTLRTWNATSKKNGTFFPAFYDMDTAFGLDNGGMENVDPEANIDYWMINDKNQIRVFTENAPYYNQNQYTNKDGKKYYQWYDRSQADLDKANKRFGTNKTQELLGTFSDTDFANSSRTKFNIVNSHLWHLIRFAGYIANNIDVTKEGDLLGWIPLGQYQLFRLTILKDVDDFIEKYFLYQNRNVGALIFNFDYNQKYLKKYVYKGDAVGNTDSIKPTYHDILFCHGRRDDFVRDWFKKRIDYLDSIFNLKQSYRTKSSTTYVPSLGIEQAFTTEKEGELYFRTTTLDSYNPNDSKYIQSTSGNTKVMGEPTMQDVQCTLTTSESIVLYYTVAGQNTRVFAPANHPITLNIPASTSSLVFTINAKDAIYSWTNFKALRLNEFNHGWKFTEVDLSNMNTIENSSFDLSRCTEMRILNLEGFKFSKELSAASLNLSTLPKIEDLNISNSIFTSLSIAEGGNLSKLNVTNTNLSDLKLLSLKGLNNNLNLNSTKLLESITINNCIKLPNITFNQCTVIDNININNAESLQSFTYDGTNNNKEISVISLTGNCESLKDVIIRNVNNCKIDLSGCTNLNSITFENVNVNGAPILPAYYNEQGERTSYEIYNSDKGFAINLKDVNFGAFSYGKEGNTFIKYSFETGHDAAAPKVEFVNFDDYEIEKENLVFNLAGFNKIKSFQISNCPYIRYIAFKHESPIELTQENISNCSGIERIFGNLIFKEKTFASGISSFKLCEWNNTAITDATIRTWFDNAMLGITDPADAEALIKIYMNEDFKADELQGIKPYTEIALAEDLNRTISGAFQGTGISTKDMYYILYMINERERISNTKTTNFSNLFSGCYNIITSETDPDRCSLSKCVFMYLNNAINITNMFPGGVRGVLYSPVANNDIWTRKGAFSDITLVSLKGMVGTLTPIASSVEDIGNIGWNMEYTDTNVFWVPSVKFDDWSAVSFDDDNDNKTVVQFNGSFTSVKTIKNLFNYNGYNSCIKCLSSGAKYNEDNSSDGYKITDFTITKFNINSLTKAFTNAHTIINSFNNIYVDLNNKAVTKNGVTYTYSGVISDSPKLVDITNSFNMYVDNKSILIDIFGGSIGARANNMFSQNIKYVRMSFNLIGFDEAYWNMSESERNNTYTASNPYVNKTYTYAILTDDMFQNIADTLVTFNNVSADMTNPIATIGIENRLFNGVNQIKTYAKFISSSVPNDIIKEEKYRFPYGIFKNCKELLGIPAFFESIDLRYASDFTNGINHLITEDDIKNNNLMNTSIIKTLSDENLLEHVISFPDYYNDSRSYVKQYDLDGNLIYAPTFSMFEDCEKLTNISMAFTRMITPVYKAGTGTIYYYLGFRLTGKAFSECTELTNAYYAFAYNHYMLGNIPYGLLYHGKETVTKEFEAAPTSINASNIDGTANNIAANDSLIYTTFTDSQCFIADPDVDLKDAYVIDMYTTTIKDAKFKNGSINDVEVYDYVTYSDSNIVSYRKYNPDNIYDRAATKYRAVSRSEVPQYKLHAPVNTGIVSSISITEEITQDKKGMTDITGLLYSNDAAGFIYMKYMRNSITYLDMTNFNDPNNGENNKYLTNYKLQSYSKDWIIKNDYNNDAYISVDELYSPAEYILNPGYNPAQTITIPGTDKVIINENYDPRKYIKNEHTHKYIINKYMYDGVPYTIEELNKIKEVLDSYGYDVGIPEIMSINDNYEYKWLEHNKPAYTYDISEDNVGIFVESAPLAKSTMNKAKMQENELKYIAKIKKVNAYNYFVPGDIFKYVSNDYDAMNNINPCKIDYAFANGNYFTVYSTASKNENVNESYREYTQGNVNDTFSTLLNYNTGIADYEIDINYYQGNILTGIPGRISPVMFEPVNNISRINYLFYNNSQIAPYTYSRYDNGRYYVGELFNKDTFKSLNKLTSLWKFMCNAQIPKQVRLHPETFLYNKNVTTVSGMFAGTIFNGNAQDDIKLGAQISGNIFNGFDNLALANGTFMAISDPRASTAYTENYRDSAISPYTVAGPSNESFVNGESYGSRGVREVSENIFDKFPELAQVQMLFYYDKALRRMPHIWDFNNLKYNGQTFTDNNQAWEIRPYYSAYYLSPDISNINEIKYGWSILTEPSTDLKIANLNFIWFFSDTFDVNVSNSSLKK